MVNRGAHSRIAEDDATDAAEAIDADVDNHDCRKFCVLVIELEEVVVGEDEYMAGAECVGIFG